MLKRYYTILGLPEGADKEAIKKAFKRLAMAYHPDRNEIHSESANLLFQDICRAYQFLLDQPEKDVPAGQPNEGDDAPMVSTIEPHKELNTSQERRSTGRRSPNDRRFELVLEGHYKGTSIKEHI